MFSRQPKHISIEEAINKARKYCAYQERCTLDVRRKLRGWGLEDQQIIKVINKLEEENFISDSRFAELYVRSKVNQKKWGKYKIEAELKARNISTSIIDEHVATIDLDVYQENIHHLIDNKIKELEKFDDIKKLQKLNLYLQAKGYETDIIIKTLKQKIN
jgi:regulatory protein